MRDPSGGIDLHAHTRYSDGRATPRELLEHAASVGVGTLAITDHESARGVREAVPLAPALGVELVAGIEVSCWWPPYTGHGGGPDIDLLGLFVDLDAPELRALEARLLDGVTARAETSCRHLATLGHPLALDEVLAASPHYPGFMAIVEALCARGCARPDAYALADAAYRAEGQRAPGMEEAIHALREAGGAVVLAHPSIVLRDGELLGERGMADLVAMGIDAVEVDHYRLDAAQREHFRRLADRFDLPATGGSDEHGRPGAFPRMGTETTRPEALARLREVARARRAEVAAP